MRRLDQFRLYYNHSIHPELLRLERMRRRNLILISVSSVLLLGLIGLTLYLNVLAITLFIMLPISFYITWLVYRIRQFVLTFKPNVVNLVLDFIDDGLNFGTLKYDSKRFIAKEQFKASMLFSSVANEYQGEDYIWGKIGELDFEMCELNVREFSRVRNRLNYVFKGVFLHAVFNKPLRGSIIILPKEFKQYLSRSIKAFNLLRAKPVAAGTLDERFEAHFISYATADAHTSSLLSSEMQEALVSYRLKTGKEIYASFIESDIYIGVTEPKDILEPFIFSSNVSFELVREFYEDIELLVSIVQDFDRHH